MNTKQIMNTFYSKYMKGTYISDSKGVNALCESPLWAPSGYSLWRLNYGECLGVLKRERLAHWGIPLPFYTILYRETNPPSSHIHQNMEFYLAVIVHNPNSTKTRWIGRCSLFSRAVFSPTFSRPGSYRRSGKMKTFIITSLYRDIEPNVKLISIDEK